MTEARRKRLILGAPMKASMGYVTVKIENEPNSPLLQRKIDTKFLDPDQPAEKKAKVSAEKEAFEALHVLGRRPRSWAEVIKRGSKVRFGVPAWAIKHAIVDAANFSKFTMKDVRRVIFVEEDGDGLVEIFGTPELDVRYARNKNGEVVRVCRPIFRSWRATLRTIFYAREVNAQQVVELVGMAGFGGVGELRPNGHASSGTCGRWRVVTASADVPDFDINDLAPRARSSSITKGVGEVKPKKAAKKKVAKKKVAKK